VDVLPKLRDLYGITIQAEGVNNDWLVVLQKLPRFKELVLHGRDFTDECMPHLRGLKELESLSLTSTRITEKGLDELKDLKNLGFLSLVGTEGITDTGFTRLPLKKIRFLNLDGTKVTDAGIAALKDSSDMEWLKLSGRTKQAGLQHLVGMKKLKRLQLEGAHATVTEMKAILAAAPKLKVIETGYAKGDYTRDGWNLGSRNEN
jgi:hypothetical protein